MKAIVFLEKEALLSRRRPVLFLLATAAVLLGLSVVAGPLAAGPEEEGAADPHAFMEDPDRCVACHSAKPEP